MRVRFHAAAEAEHLDQVAYYEALQPGLGARFLAAAHFRRRPRYWAGPND